VIVDDIGWLTEPYFEDGTVASHVKTLVSGSRLVYVSAAGNLANSHYQGGFYNGGSGFHDFSRGTDATYKDLYVHMPAGYSVLVVMEWNDKFGLSANDYDLGIVDLAAPGVPLAVSVNTQDGTGDPLEYISYTNTGSDKDIAVIAHKYSGVAKTLELYIYTNNPTNIYSNNIVPSDSVFGHAAVPGVITAAAAPASSPATIEPFSGRGPVTISYPAAETRKKPDITGIDGVTITGAGGFSSPFYGTSAAAPHIAAIVAQIWAAHPSLTPPQVRTALYTSAIDLGAVGGDPKFGTGRADAMAMEAKLFKSKIGVFRNSTRQWFLDSNGNGIWDGTPTDKAYKFMLSTDTPITGDWDGNNKTEIGAFRNSTRQWLLDTNGDGMWEATDKVYTFMLSTDTPITGDWNGDYKTEIGVFRNRTRQWFLDYNGNGRWDGPPNDKVYTFMLSTDTPVTGDWNGNGKTKIGVFRNSTQRWYLDYNGNGIWDGPPTDKVYVFGMSTDMAITGDWDRNGKTEIGVFRNSIQKWLLDYNGNGIWDGAPKDKLYKFMLSTDTPVTGDWK
jgi:hypothetical protein